MEKTITKEILKNAISTGKQPAIEFLYTEYGAMLYGYVLQFTRDQQEAENLLVSIFTYLSSHLTEACNSGLGVYCWLQSEARKIILRERGPDASALLDEGRGDLQETASGKSCYFSLLGEASHEQQWIFRELFLAGRGREEVAGQLDKDLPYIDKQLKESLLIINRNLV
ncbi:MAG: hypothetical protein P4L51_04935 [Puia sp.]|nr:hypothetical protein [Puia sp.]